MADVNAIEDPYPRVPMLYAWVGPLSSDAQADHTWVTSYETPEQPYPDIEAVIKAGECYWYCCDGYRPAGADGRHARGLIATSPRNMESARKMCAPNEPRAHEAFLQYGIDGICHQVSNRVLASAGRSAATVSLARRYWFSNFVFGTYGRGAAAKSGIALHAFPPPVDEFERHFYDMLGLYANLQPLRRIRDELGRRLDALRGELPKLGALAAQRVNGEIKGHLEKVRAVLAPGEYARLFGEPPGGEVCLVDPGGFAPLKAAA